MEKVYELANCRIQVIFNDQILTIKSPKALQQLLAEDIDMRTGILVDLIKKDYFEFKGKELDVERDSMIVEIWGHVYASYFANAMKNLIELNLVENLADLIIKKSDSIDCGEKGVDHNRAFWDILSNFKGLILKFLPEKTREQK